MRAEEWPQVVLTKNDGTPCVGKLTCTVWDGGKPGDCIKWLPIVILPMPTVWHVILYMKHG